MAEIDYNAGWIYLIKVNDVYKVGKTTDWKARMWDYIDKAKLNVIPLRLTRDIDNLDEHEREIQDVIYPHVTRVKSLERGAIAARDKSEWFRLKDIPENQLIELFEEFQRKVFEEAGWTTPEYYYQRKCVRLCHEGKCGTRACNALCGGGAWGCRLYHLARLDSLYIHLEHIKAGEYYIDEGRWPGAAHESYQLTLQKIKDHEDWLEHDNKLNEQE